MDFLNQIDYDVLVKVAVILCLSDLNVPEWLNASRRSDVRLYD